jgi:hypothetical protein
MEIVSDVVGIGNSDSEKDINISLVIIIDMIMFDKHYPVMTSGIDPCYFIA